ncbi:MAG: hypothetical protein N3G76_01170 [Candidatus Micrarchaeota archaeon]|nr:hypothetical protein [Candidatus Micrarchaeota archaeon]
MLSETLYKRMMLDKEFISSMAKVGAVRQDSPTKGTGQSELAAAQNIAFHDYHKSAFELSLLFSPRASRTPSLSGDFLLTVISIAKLGKAYLSNLGGFISTSDLKKSGVKRLDKVNLSLSQMLKMLEVLEKDVQSSIDEYITSGKAPDRKKISYYSKLLLRIRRSYFRVQKKLQSIEKHLCFSRTEYQPYAPLVMLACSHQGQRNKRPLCAQPSSLNGAIALQQIPASEYIEAVYAYDTVCSRQKRKEHLDIAKTSFIASYMLPRDAVVRHVQALKNLDVGLVYGEGSSVKPGTALHKPKISPATE